MSLGEGLGFGFRWVAGGGFMVENVIEGTGKGGGECRGEGGVGTDKKTGKLLSKLLFSKPAFVFNLWPLRLPSYLRSEVALTLHPVAFREACNTPLHCKGGPPGSCSQWRDPTTVACGDCLDGAL